MEVKQVIQLQRLRALRNRLLAPLVRLPVIAWPGSRETPGLLAVSILVATSVALGPARPVPSPVLVPVVLEGIRYAPEAFNALNRSLGVPLHFVALTGVESLFAFRSTDQARAFIEARSGRVTGRVPGLAAPLPQPLANHGCANHTPPTGVSIFTESTSCGGGSIGGYAPSEWPDLRNLSPNLHDQMSALKCASDSFTYYCVIFEHINYGGSSLWTLWGNYRDNLADWGFNDKASSLIIYTYP
jgi:hypothetical protein